MVKSTYNFVPAPKENQVYKPDWADQVSHDIPFSDGESGEIAIKIIAETPIFIRNGHARDTEENEFSHAFIDGKKTYFIPGTSLKGMVRNVLEMMSFSRLKTNDDVFSLRDLDHADFRREVSGNRQLKTGWLQKRGDNWVIVECDSGRVAIGEIEQTFSKNDRRVNFKDCSAAEKYRQIPSNQLIQNFSFDRDLMAGNFKRGELYHIKPHGTKTGTLVFFGSIDNKRYEYFFEAGVGADILVPAWLMEQFETIDKKLENTQWQYFQEIQASQIPVFFDMTRDENGNSIVKHFGFSRLYKLTNTFPLKELEPLKSYLNSKGKYQLDLAQTIFGIVKDPTSSQDKNRNAQTLKGRVLFGHALKTTENADNGKTFDSISASPKASYAHFYLKNGANYLDGDAELRGFKKYPVHEAHKADLQHKKVQQKRKEEGENFNEKIVSQMQPLPPASSFTGKIRFHNLKKIEVGTLLSALTLHGNHDQLFHSLGGGKPFGFGKVKLEITDLKVWENTRENDKMTTPALLDYLADFESLMDAHLKKILGYSKKWMDSDQMQELLAMASPPASDHLLVYPEIETGADGKTNEFKLYEHGKKDRNNPRNDVAPQPLNPYSQQIRLPQLQNIAAEKAKADAKLAAEKAAAEQKAKALATEQAYQNALVSEERKILENFLFQYENHPEKATIQARLDELNKAKKDDKIEKARNTKLEFKSNKFQAIQKVLSPFDKLKGFDYTDEQKMNIEQAIRIAFESEIKNERKSKFHERVKGKYQLRTWDDFPWTKIASWLGKSVARQLYDELITSKT